jgi:hypothetical protein
MSVHLRALAVVAALMSLVGMQIAMHPTPAMAAPLATNCAAVTVTVHPGLNPPLQPGHTYPGAGRAPDAPKGPFLVSLPVYPGATPLRPFVGSPFPEYQESPYLQTAGLEYVTDATSPAVDRWYTRALHACGWISRGSWGGNTSPFDHGLTFEAKSNPNLSVEISFGFNLAAGSYIAYGVEEIIFPPRPAASYLHGPFVDLRIAVQHNTYVSGKMLVSVTHSDVRDRATITRLVSAINRITVYQTVFGLCSGGGGGSYTGPAWLSFIRPDGTVAHAFANGPGSACGGGFAVNGVRWLTGGIGAWNQILSLAGGRG